MSADAEEDVAPQRAALADARAHLARALDDLSAAAHDAARAARSKRGTPDLPAVYAHTNAVRRAEETVDLAALDLDTAAGGDA